MSHYAILHDLTLELRRRIFAALQETPDADFGLSSAEEDITLAPPPDPSNDGPLLSLFLYRVEPDGYLRNQRALPVGPDGLRFPPLALQLSYLITPLDEVQEQNHLLLGRVLQHFHDHPLIETIDDEPVGASFGGGSPEVRLSLAPLDMESLTRIWSAMESAYRLSVVYHVRAVVIDSLKPEIAAHRAREVHTVVGTRRREP